MLDDGCSAGLSDCAHPHRPVHQGGANMGKRSGLAGWRAGACVPAFPLICCGFRYTDAGRPPSCNDAPGHQLSDSKGCPAVARKLNVENVGWRRELTYEHRCVDGIPSAALGSIRNGAGCQDRPGSSMTLQQGMSHLSPTTRSEAAHPYWLLACLHPAAGTRFCTHPRQCGSRGERFFAPTNLQHDCPFDTPCATYDHC